MSNVTTPSRFYLIFNSAEESLRLIVKYLATIAEATRFPHLGLLLKALEVVHEQLCTLITLQLISQIDVWFNDQMVQLDLCYHHDVFAQDAADLSFLQFLDIEVEALIICFYTPNIDNARLLGFAAIEAIKVPGLSLELVPATQGDLDRFEEETISRTNLEDAVVEDTDTKKEFDEPEDCSSHS